MGQTGDLLVSLKLQETKNSPLELVVGLSFFDEGDSKTITLWLVLFTVMRVPGFSGTA